MLSLAGIRLVYSRDLQVPSWMSASFYEGAGQLCNMLTSELLGVEPRCAISDVDCQQSCKGGNCDNAASQIVLPYFFVK